MSGCLVSEKDEQAAKWHGVVVEEIAAPLESVWKIASVFCGLKRWVPTLESCEMVEGEEGKPGCLRYVAGSGSSYSRADGQNIWAKERLVAYDSELHSFSYVMEDGNIMELKGYKAHFHLSEGSSPQTTNVEWFFEMNPMDKISEAVATKKHMESFSRYLNGLRTVVTNEIHLTA